MKTDRTDLYKKLRKDYPLFIYESFSYAIDNNELKIIFVFRLTDEIIFKPLHRIPLPAGFRKDNLADELLQNIIFNLGMVELISYWKAACSPKLLVKPYALSKDQILWWKKLYLNGLGEFFYLNGLDPDEDFMHIEADEGKPLRKGNAGKQSDAILIPLGGGKDSVVSLEMLKNYKNCIPFIINPREASIETALSAGYKESEIATDFRSIDKKLLDLNERGFLNGHTPFSAMLAFSSMLVAYIYGIPEIALSNESSANEPTIPGTNINHQYSKSIAFENDFRHYVKEYITDDINYYSFLRPLNELQIAKLFSSFEGHFDGFRSCNVGSKENKWCGSCPKCLFTFIMLAPFISHDKLIGIFGKNMYQDRALISIFDQLTGLAEEKPFECVGTIDEVNAAILYYIQNNEEKSLPPLIVHYLDQNNESGEAASSFDKLLKEFGSHNLPSEAYAQLLKNALHVS